MVKFSIDSSRYIPIGRGRSIPFFEALYGNILDVDIDDTTSAIDWDDNEGHPVLIGDAQPSYRMTFSRAPNIVYDQILLLQQHAESIPGLEVGQFVTIVDGSAFELLPGGGERQLAVGEFLPI